MVEHSDMSTKIAIKRGTLAQLQSAAASGYLTVAEPYLLIDLGKLALATSVNTFQQFSPDGSLAQFSILRAFWAEQVHTEASGLYAGKWVRLAGSFDGYDEDYEHLLAAQPQLVAGTDGAMVYAPMMSNTAPAPQVASASSTSSATNYPAYYAFDANEASAWRSTGSTFTSNSGGAIGNEWIQIDLGANPIVCSAFSSTPAAGDTTHAPKDAQLLGSNDGSNWTTLMTVTGATDPDAIYEFSNTTAYRYLRLLITRVQGGTASQVYLGGVSLFAPGKSLVNTTDGAGSTLYVKVA